MPAQQRHSGSDRSRTGAEHGRRPGAGGQPERSLIDHWPGYLSAGYFDDKGNLLTSLVSRGKVEPLVRAMVREVRPPLTTHQVRRFFQHCRAIESRLRTRRSTWDNELANFRKLDVAVADAMGKHPPKVPRLFHEFVRLNVKTVQNERDFLLGFLPHFEALVGFGAQFLSDDRGRS